MYVSTFAEQKQEAISDQNRLIYKWVMLLSRPKRDRPEDTGHLYMYGPQTWQRLIRVLHGEDSRRRVSASTAYHSFDEMDEVH